MKIINKIKDIISSIQIEIDVKLYPIKHYIADRKYKKKYPDYIEDEYNYGDLKFIWGIKSWDDLTGKDVNLYTMNDIDITYSRESKQYSLGIETAYMFKDVSSECRYLKRLLNAFTKFMDDNGYHKNQNYFFFFSNCSTTLTSDNIPELYTNFRIFVEGYCKLYDYEEET